MNKLFTTFLLTLLLSQAAIAQISATTNNNGSQLSQILAGNGVTISNVTMNCPNGAAGTFTCNNCNLGMTEGIVLTTGSDTMITGPNNSGSEGWDNLASGDPSLNTLAGATTKDACALEFDMKVLSDSVEFRYVFGSEEYTEWVNSGYNDAFAFFISGPGITGQQNIALIPGTTTPVTIDNVNDNSYSQYYVDNGDGYTAPYNNNNTYIQYDGFTKVLTAKRKGLQPCQTYHLKLVIADAGDGIYDSGVFLEANSLTSNYVSIDSAETDEPNTTNAMEGCVRGKVNFRLQKPINQASVVHFGIGGSAINGVDYTAIADSIIIPAGDTIVSLFINPISDGIVEGTERIVISLFTACDALPYDSAVLLLIDSFGVDAGLGMTICAGDQAQLNALGLGLVNWNNASSLSSASILNPIATPTATTTYTVTADLGVCQSSDTVTITVISAPFSVSAGPDVASCSSTSMQLNAVVTGSTVNGNPFTYNWTPANTLSAA
ncbi:MAG TPA: choice-of-anchor L domain-containing protein, partial [Chitinophagales bacterium]|nr:choice-of-anchor L domain-containing protein [Chitinophagales bacterium]